VLVADASAVVAALLNATARTALGGDVQVHAPHLLDSEVASAIRSRVRRGKLDSRAGWDLLERYRRLGITRHSTFPMFERLWELRHNLSAYDAAYVVLAETLDCGLLTADARISRAPDLHCPVTVLPG
jgi:predicted nucleic acid-binding protein